MFNLKYNLSLVGCSPFPGFQTQNESVTLNKFQAHHWLVKQDLGRCQTRLTVAYEQLTASQPPDTMRDMAPYLCRNARDVSDQEGDLDRDSLMRYWFIKPILSFLGDSSPSPKDKREVKP